MFEGITFIEFGNDIEGVAGGSSFIVAVRDLSEVGFMNLEWRIRDKVETMTEYDSLEEKVQEALEDMGAEAEVIYPDRYITIC